MMKNKIKHPEEKHNGIFNEPPMQYKLLFVTYEYGKYINGGVGRVINGLTAHITGRINFDVFLLNSDPACRGWYARLFRIKNGKSKRKCYKSFYINALILLIKKEKYDLVHFMHSGLKIAAIIKSIRENFPEIKLIYSCHSISKFDKQVRNSCRCNVVSEALIMNDCDHIHLLNRTSRELLQQSYPVVVEKKPVTIIPNGIEANEFRKTSVFLKMRMKKSFHSNENLIIVCMTRWAHGKGLEYLLDAVPDVAREEKKIKFVIAGKKKCSWENGYPEYLNMLEKKTAACGSSVTILGWLDNIRRNTLFSIADIWIMPSLLEYFPYSILEPAICRIPIISSRIDSVTDLFEDNRECLYFEPGNAKELADKIVHLIRNSEFREYLQQNAFNKLYNGYLWSNVAKMYRNMYRSILSDRCF